MNYKKNRPNGLVSTVRRPFYNIASRDFWSSLVAPLVGDSKQPTQEKQRGSPQFVRNMPPVAGNIMWSRLGLEGPAVQEIKRALYSFKFLL